jgi:hypothetical protein
MRALSAARKMTAATNVAQMLSARERPNAKRLCSEADEPWGTWISSVQRIPDGQVEV